MHDLWHESHVAGNFSLGASFLSRPKLGRPPPKLGRPDPKLGRPPPNAGRPPPNPPRFLSPNPPDCLLGYAIRIVYTNIKDPLLLSSIYNTTEYKKKQIFIFTPPYPSIRNHPVIPSVVGDWHACPTSEFDWKAWHHKAPLFFLLTKKFLQIKFLNSKQFFEGLQFLKAFRIFLPRLFDTRNHHVFVRVFVADKFKDTRIIAV